MKNKTQAERKQIAKKAVAKRESNAAYIKHATAALDAWETIREERSN